IYVLYSDDLGNTWKKSHVLGHKGVAMLEPGIEYISKNELLMTIRLNLGSILFARSTDFGLTWKFEDSNFLSPSSPQKMLRLHGSDSLLLVWNNTDKDAWKHFGNRNPLSLAFSKDKGRT